MIDAIQTGVDDVDELISVLLSTNMFVAGVFACLFDNILPGDPEDRGITKWRTQADEDNEKVINTVYGKPFRRFHNFFKE